MNQETNLILQAIAESHEQCGWIKDYAFPIASAFFTSLLGAMIAYLFFHYQEKHKIEKEKLDTSNRWLLLADEAMQNLISIKSNYCGKLGNQPIQRTLAIPTILFSNHSIEQDYSALSFIVAYQKENETIKWNQIPLIRALFKNYNYVQEVWQKRNELERPLKEQVLRAYSNKGYADVTMEEIVQCVGADKILALVDLTETLIVLTDDLLTEFYDFLQGFPVITKSLINENGLKRYGSVLTFQGSSNKKLTEMLELSPEANFSSLVPLFGASEDELQAKYKSGYR